MNTHLTVLVLLLVVSSGVHGAACRKDADGEKQVFWGDLHVHTAYSLDAYGFGTLNDPGEAYAFARGEPIVTLDGATRQIDRPLDFVAVTDHAEWFDFLYLCTDPGMGNHPDCRNLRENANPQQGINLFRQYVVPSITLSEPGVLDVCKEDPEHCEAAWISQWQRVQQHAADAYEPCEFTSFVAYEWSSTKDFRHTHRNVVFASDTVPDRAFDYIRYPTVQALFEQLDEHCSIDAGCDVLTIPHNTNMGDGTTFDVERETDRQLALRSRYERLVEIHQEKGNSECLSPLGATDETDCNFEIRLTKLSQPAGVADYDSAEWERMRSTYVRGLLLRGLASWQRSGEAGGLRMGVVGATDTHTATPGFVNEAAWPGPAFGIGSLDRAMTRLDWNPGGITAVWAQENTRESLFAAMKRREVYATSGPRIVLRFEADQSAMSCDTASAGSVQMGGDFSFAGPHFRIRVGQDQAPIARIEVIKGSLEVSGYEESVFTVWEGSAAAQCVTWHDESFVAGTPAFWYARVIEAPTQRWSANLCRAEDRCDEFPGAERTTEERAWSSPVWYLPEQ